ncbi:MAG: hypothetical protein RIB67_09175 [Miltoncostaeaceae bacterium]
MDETTNSDPFESISGFFESGAWDLTVLLLQAFAVTFWLALIFWTFQDARRRIENPGLVAACVALSVVLPYLGSIVYLIVRPPEYLDDVRERELELIALEQRLAETGDTEGQAMVGKLLAREGITGGGDAVATKRALRQAGVAIQDDVKDLDARLTELEFRLRSRAGVAERAVEGAPVAEDGAGRTGETGRRLRGWRTRQDQDAYD